MGICQKHLPEVRWLCENVEIYKVISHSGLDLPYPKTKTLVVIAIIAVLVIPNSLAICAVAGATMEDDTGEMKVNDETTSVAAHFFRRLQLKKKYHCTSISRKPIQG